MNSGNKETGSPPYNSEAASKRFENVARELYDVGDFQGSLKNIIAAFEITPTDRLERKIHRVRAVVASQKKIIPYSMDQLIDQTVNLSIQEDKDGKNVKVACDKSNVSTANKLLAEARLLFEAGKTAKSLEAVISAYDLVPDPKTATKMKKLRDFLSKEIAARESGSSQREPTNDSPKPASTPISVENPSSEHALTDSKGGKSEKTVSPRKSVTKHSPADEIVNGSSDSQHSSATPVKHQNNQPAGDATDLLAVARLLYDEKRISESLAVVQRAYEIDSNPKTARKIERLVEQLAEEEAAAKKIAGEEERPNSGDCQSLLQKEETSRMLESEARKLCHSHNYREALKALLRADDICPNDKYKRRIGRLEELIGSEEERESEDEDVEAAPDDADISQLVDQTTNLSIHVDSKATVAPFTPSSMVEVSPGFRVPDSLHRQLFDYQKEGIAWLWNLHKTSTGGILADDMGLGKTFQAIAFLTGYFLSDEASKRRRTAIILAPVSVINAWQAEFSKWAPSLKLFTYYELTKAARIRGLTSVQRHGGILLTTYNMLVAGIQDIGTDQSDSRSSAYTPWHSSAAGQPKLGVDGPCFTYDYMILDEAHRIKNTSTKIAKAVRAISSEHRLLLTGTAVQNNLRELWSLFDFTHSGRLLGTQKTFLGEYEKPIMRSRERDASGAERLHGKLMADSLQKMIAPYILRRTKADTLTRLAVNDTSKRLPRKNEIVVWVFLSPLQETIYRDFLKLDHVKELLFGTTKRSPLVELTILKKLCDHPRLLSSNQCANLGLEVSQTLPGSEIRAPSRTALLMESGKLVFLVRLLETFQEESLETGMPAHRTLVFSQSLRLLNMAEAVILGANESQSRRPDLPKHRILRLDGRLKKLSERLDMLEEFASNKTYTAMLLTTQVGGVGLTITSADRVVILDPSWNPAVDAQAVDRVYRIGQASNVVVYRLITCATVEEKIYRRQVFKDSVIRQTIGRAASDHPASNDDGDPYRYFTRQELVDLFKLDENSHFSATQRQLTELHGASERKTDDDLENHLSFLTGSYMSDVVFDISDHDLLFSRPEEKENYGLEKGAEQHLDTQFAQNRLKYGEAAIQLESQGQFEAAERMRNTALGYPIPQKKHQPADGLFFIPSKADTQRPMLNAPRLGSGGIQPPQFNGPATALLPEPPIMKLECRTTAIDLTEAESDQSLPVSTTPDRSSDFDDPNSSRQSPLNRFIRPSVLPPHFREPQAASSPVIPKQHLTRLPPPLSSNSNPGISGDAEMITLDLTQAMDDGTAVECSVQMASLRKSLAKSGILLESSSTSSNGGVQPSVYETSMSVDDVRWQEKEHSGELSSNGSLIKPRDLTERKSKSIFVEASCDASMPAGGRQETNTAVVEDSCSEEIAVNTIEDSVLLTDSVEIIEDSLTD